MDDLILTRTPSLVNSFRIEKFSRFWMALFVHIRHKNTAVGDIPLRSTDFYPERWGSNIGFAQKIRQIIDG
jgi:hypothetical protein